MTDGASTFLRSGEEEKASSFILIKLSGKFIDKTSAGKILFSSKKRFIEKSI